MSSKRDLVRVEPSERIDLPDFKAVQDGAHGEARAFARTFLFASDLKKILGGFFVTPSDPADALIHISEGRGVGVAAHDDGMYEYGTAFGVEGESTLTLDFTGKPNGTYGVYVRFNAPASTVANRMFYNGTAGSEEVQAIDTRYEIEWDALLLITTSTPSEEYLKIGQVVWGGATVVLGNVSWSHDLFFEGKATSYAHVWGDGVNDRSALRAAYGVTDLYTWVHAIRRQIEEIVGDGQKWYENFTRIEIASLIINGVNGYWNAANFVHSGNFTIFGGDWLVDANSFSASTDAGKDMELWAGKDIVGGVLTPGDTIDMTYGPHTRFSTMIGSSVGHFLTSADTTGIAYTTGGVTTLTGSGTSSMIKQYEIPLSALDVPHGSKITKLRYYIEINDTNTQFLLYWNVKSLVDGSNTQHNGPFYEAADGTGYKAKSGDLGALPYDIVDYTNYQYFVEVYAYPQVLNKTLKIHGVGVTFLRNNLVQETGSW